MTLIVCSESMVGLVEHLRPLERYSAESHLNIGPIRSASILKDGCAVFNIAGNKYRIVM